MNAEVRRHRASGSPVGPGERLTVHLFSYAVKM